MISINLKDAYILVVIAKEHRKFLRFQWKGNLYEFLCLPFGLSSAPLIFTKLLKLVMAEIRQHGTQSVIFLDDLMIMTQSKEALVKEVTCIIQLLESLGFVVNHEKSQLEPSQSIIYLGFSINSVTMKISLPEEKVSQIQQDCQWALQQKSVSIQQLCHLIGRLTTSIQAVLPAPLCYRNLQRVKNNAFKHFHSFDTHAGLLRSECKRGTLLVGEQPTDVEWEISAEPTTRHCTGDGCIPFGVGSSLRGSVHKRPVVRSRMNPAHQLSRVDGRNLCSKSL